MVTERDCRQLDEPGVGRLEWLVEHRRKCALRSIWPFTQSPMRRRGTFLLILVVIASLAVWGVYALPKHLVGIHQSAVTQELAQWKDEYSVVDSHAAAVHTAEMIEYVKNYYVPSEGYRGTPDTEKALETQRQQTIDAFVEALCAYTNEDFGEDSDKWLEYLESAKPQPSSDDRQL